MDEKKGHGEAVDDKASEAGLSQVLLAGGHLSLEVFLRAIKKCRKKSPVEPRDIPVMIEIGPDLPWLKIIDVSLVDRKAAGDSESYAILIKCGLLPEDVPLVKSVKTPILGADGRPLS